MFFGIRDLPVLNETENNKYFYFEINICHLDTGKYKIDLSEMTNAKNRLPSKWKYVSRTHLCENKINT